MGLIAGVMGALFGDGRNVVSETIGMFREGSETAAIRDAQTRQQAMTQLASEFARPRRTVFDSVMDGLNRLPRPAMALGTLALFGAACPE